MMLHAIQQAGLWPLLGVVLPLLVALATKQSTHSGVQGTLFAGLAVLLGVVEEGVKALDVGHTFQWETALGAALGAWVLGQVAHSNLWKSLGLASKLQAVGSTPVDAVVAEDDADVDDTTPEAGLSPDAPADVPAP